MANSGKLGDSESSPTRPSLSRVGDAERARLLLVPTSGQPVGRSPSSKQEERAPAPGPAAGQFRFQREQQVPRSSKPSRSRARNGKLRRSGPVPFEVEQLAQESGAQATL